MLRFVVELTNRDVSKERSAFLCSVWEFLNSWLLEVYRLNILLNIIKYRNSLTLN